jgi:hypothetical protein
VAKRVQPEPAFGEKTLQQAEYEAGFAHLKLDVGALWSPGIFQQP